MKLGLALLLWAAPIAHADTPRDQPQAIEVDRADAPAGRTEFGFDGGAPVDGWGATIGGGWLESPIVFGLPDLTTTEPVRRRFTALVGGAIALGNSVVIDGRWTLSRQAGDRLQGTGSERALQKLVPGDLRFGARIRVMTREHISVFVRGDLALPTGDAGDFAGDAGYSIAWRLIARATIAHGIVIAATAGLRLRGTEVIVAHRLVGNESLAAAGIAVPLPPLRPLWCKRDQVKLTADASAILGDKIGGERGPSPVEVRLGIVTQPRPAWTFGLRVGTGLTDEIGSPELRATVELSYGGSWKLLPPITISDDDE